MTKNFIKYLVYTPDYILEKDDVKLLNTTSREELVKTICKRDGKKIVKNILSKKREKPNIDYRGIYIHPELSIVGITRIPEGGVLEDYEKYITIFNQKIDITDKETKDKIETLITNVITNKVYTKEETTKKLIETTQNISPMFGIPLEIDVTITQNSLKDPFQMVINGFHNPSIPMETYPVASLYYAMGYTYFFSEYTKEIQIIKNIDTSKLGYQEYILRFYFSDKNFQDMKINCYITEKQRLFPKLYLGIIYDSNVEIEKIDMYKYISNYSSIEKDIKKIEFTTQNFTKSPLLSDMLHTQTCQYSKLINIEYTDGYKLSDRLVFDKLNFFSIKDHIKYGKNSHFILNNDFLSYWQQYTPIIYFYDKTLPKVMTAQSNFNNFDKLFEYHFFQDLINIKRIEFLDYKVNTALPSGLFKNCKSLEEFVFDCKTPVNIPLNENIFDENITPTIFVPKESVDLYKQDQNWKKYADKIVAIEE